MKTPVLNSNCRAPYGCLFAVAGLLLLGGNSSLDAATIYWTNAVPAEYTNAIDWSTHAVPGSADTADITNGGTVAVSAADPTWTITEAIAGDVTGSTGFVAMTGGTFKPNVIYLGNVGTAQGYLVQTGGALSQGSGSLDWHLGGATSGSAAVGVWSMSGGTANIAGNLQIGAYGVGEMNISGGATLTTGVYTVSARNPGSFGVMDINGGTFIQNNSTTHLVVGEQGTGILNLRSGAINNTSSSTTGALAIGGSENTLGTVGIVNLNGGTLNTLNVSVGFQASYYTFGTFNFNGGTLQSRGNNTTFMYGLNNAYVWAGGAVIDTQTYTDTVSQSLTPPTGQGVTNIPVAGGGTGYVTPPVVQISGGGGVGATAVALTNGTGAVSSLLITCPGVNYSSAPTVTLIGGGYTSAATIGTVGIGVNSVTGGLTKLGAGTLELSGTNSYTGDTVVSGGILKLDLAGSSPGAFRLANGASLNLNFSGAYVAGACYTNGVALPGGTYTAGNLGAFIDGGGSLQVASNVSTGNWGGGGADNNWNTAGNWNNGAVPIFPIGLTFAGSARLTNTNNLTGITASSLTFDAGAGAFVLNGNAITNSGNLGFNGNPAAPVTETVNLNLAWSAKQTIDVQANGSLVLGGNVNSVNDLFTIDAGTLTLGGSNMMVDMVVNGGTNIITGSTTLNGNTGGGNYDKFYVADGDTLANCTGTLIIQPGAALTVSNSFNDSFVIGRDSGRGKLIQNGGSFNYNPANELYLFIGASAAANTAEYDMNGGLLNMSGKTLVVGIGNGASSIDTLIQTGGVITNALRLAMLLNSPFSGTSIYTLSGGSIYIGASGITTGGSGYAINLGGGMVGSYATWSSSLNMNLTNLNGSVTFNPAGYTNTLSGALTGNGGLTVAGSGRLVLSSVGNSYTGDTTISGGTLQLNQTGSSLGAFHLASGTVLNLNFTGNYAVAGGYTNGVILPVGTYNSGNLPGLITGTGNLVVAGSISTGIWTGGGTNNNWSTAGNWNNGAEPIFPIGLTFAGVTRLTNTNDLTGIPVSSLTFDVAAGAFVLNGNGLTNSGGIAFNGNPAAAVTQTVNLNLALSASQTIDTPTNGNLNLGGAITSVNDLYKIDAGTLTLGGTNTMVDLGVDGGTNIITGSTTLNGNTAGGNYDRFYVAEGEHVANCVGTLILQPGATLTVSNNFNDSFVIGRDSGRGKLIQNGGTFSYNPANELYLYIGASTTANTAEYDMNGGLLDMNGKTLVVDIGNNAGSVDKLIQTGGVITNASKLAMLLFSPFSGTSVYTLSGGSIYLGTNGITTGGSGYAINLGGGTVGAESSWSSALNLNLTNLNGSVTFDTEAGNIITLSGVLSGSGGLTVIGSGTLDFTNSANSYAGDTIVNAGTLQLDVAGYSPGAGAFRITNGALFNLTYSGTYGVHACYTNGVSLPVGVYTSANLPGFITGSGSLTVASSFSTGIWYGGGADNNWSTAGNWDQNAVPIFPIGLTFVGPGGLTNNNNLLGIMANGITFDAAAGAFVLNGNAITNNGSVGFNGNPAAPVTQTVNLNQVLIGNKTIDTPANGNLILGGTLTTTNDLYTVDAGTLTLGSNNTLLDLGVDGGTTYITGSTTLNGIVGGGNYDRFYVGEGEHVAGCYGTLIIQPGGTLNVAGNFSDAFVIGRDGGSGRVIQNGGTFTYNPANQGILYIGASAAANTAEYDMNGGLLDMVNGKTLAVGFGNGASSINQLIQTGGLINNVGTLALPAIGTSAGLSVYTLSGGSIYMAGIGITTSGGASRYAINLGGGTVGAEADWSSALNMNLTNLNGSVTFDTAGNTITLSGVLSGSGGLTNSGGGKLVLSGTNTYTGNTTVSGGTLEVVMPVIATNSTVTVASGAVIQLDFAVTNTVAALVLNGVNQAAGVYDSTTGAPYVTGSGSLLVPSLVAPLGTNAYLANLVVSNSTGTLVFYPAGFTTNNTGIYYATNAYGAGPVTVTVTNVDPGATNNWLSLNGGTSASLTNMVASGPLTLNLGSNNVTVQVVSEDLSQTNNYVVAVSQQGVPLGTNAFLASLAVNPPAGTLPGFATNVYSYSVTNAYTNNPVAVTASSVDTNATLTLTFNNVSAGALTNGVAGTNQTLQLNPPTNTVTVRVVSQDQSQTNVYTVNVLLQPSQTVPKLTNSVSGSTLTLSWPTDHLGYRLLVQTGSLTKGVSSNTNDWTMVPGSTAITTTNITIIKTGVTNGYYRLVYP